MRIALDGRVITDRFPGIGRYAYSLARTWHEVAPEDELIVLVTADQTGGRLDLRALGRQPGVRLVPVHGDLFAPTSQWRVRRALGRVAPDVFHATYWLSGLRPGVPTVLSLYDLIGRRVPGAVPGWRAHALWWIVRAAARGARHVVTLSEWSKRDLVSETGLRPSAITVTPLAPDPQFRPVAPAEVAALRDRLGLAERYVLYVGTNKPHKNLPLLLDAWDRLAADRPDVLSGSDDEPLSLVLAGRWDPRYLDRAAIDSRPGRTGPVKVLGAVAEPDLPALYSGAAVFAFPSRYEGFGLPPLEAMACGAPVIAADATSLPEVIADAGVLLDPDDPVAWAEALARVLTQPAWSAELARRGLDRAAQFTWRATVDRTRAALAGAAATRSRP